MRNMQANDLKEARLSKLKKIRELGWNPYTHSYEKTHSVKNALESEGQKVKTAGRLLSFREHGNIAFADLKDETGKIQIFFQKALLGEEYKNIRLLDMGDFVGVEGEVGRTVAGEISILPLSFTLLSKATLPLPSEWFGIKDIETRYRQRYLDLILNPQVREVFNMRTKIVSGVREYLDNLGFWEVETPTLQIQYGGANAKPFTTHLNALNQDVYLRIADELYLKRLIVGGYERVYEICKDFRNEGIDQTHFPEFTMIEWYEAYADYHTVMDRAEGLLKHLAQKIFSSTVLKVGDRQIDIGNEWPRIEMSVILKDRLGIDVDTATVESLLDYAKNNLPGMEILGGETKGQLVFKIFDHTIPKTLIEPTFIIDYPEDISPLSKDHRSKPGWVERFEGYIGGKEIFDGWSELTDPVIQRERFMRDTDVVREDKDEAQKVDESFLEAMEYGMPPFGGIGVGIDRLTMFLTNTWAIKEVVLFPTLRGEVNEKIVDPIKGTEEKIATTVPNSESTDSLSRDAAFQLLTKYIESKNLIKHSLAAEVSMKGIYKHLHENDYDSATEELWGVTGLLHDLDYEVAQRENLLEKHGILLFERDPNIVPEPIAHAIKAHNFKNTGVDPESDLDWSISCVDQLTGLIVSSALINPDKKLNSIDSEFVMKRFNTPSFSRNVDRENIRLCESKLNIPLDQFISITLSSMQGIADELGL